MMRFKSAGVFGNDSESDMTIYLEMDCEEIVLEPGHEIELLVEELEDYFPLSILYHSDGLQIIPRQGSPSWLVIFKGQEIEPGHPTKLSDYE